MTPDCGRMLQNHKRFYEKEAENINSKTATLGQRILSNAKMMDDRTLVRNVIAGDVNAFKLLISKNERLVGHMVGRLVRNESEREELCQDVFLKVYEKLSEFSFQSKLSTWIATIAYRHAINHLRKSKMTFSEIPEEESFTARFVETENPESAYAEQDMDVFVKKMIEELPAQYKVVLTLFHLEQMTYPEICEVTQLPEGTVKSYLFRARTMLKEKVKLLLGKEEIL